MVRTRFAPSPTGYLHIGGVRTALFAWAYARKNHGVFVLRIEDTDSARSSASSIQAVLEGLRWVGLDYDEGPFYQTQRFERYQDVMQQLLAGGHAYHCYCSVAELEAMRLAQEAAGQKPRYNHHWRPESGKRLPPIPDGVSPVVRFKTPLTGTVAWDDAVKGRIEFRNEELDDVIIARSDGTPTYNFCVVVDDWEMQITHVLRGDDHINNTPRQINILKALGAALPVYGHLPMILNADGQKMSKRRDAVNVVDYADQGILPEALLNYLARLGWGHGDDEIFTLQQFVTWFDLSDINASAARFSQEKLLWLNAQHIKMADVTRLADLIQPRLKQAGIDIQCGPALAEVVALVRPRVQDLNGLLAQSDYFYRRRLPLLEEVERYLSPSSHKLMACFASCLADLGHWEASAIHQLFKSFCAQQGIKMPQLGMPLRLLVCGTSQTPPIEAVLALLGKDEVLARINTVLET